MHESPSREGELPRLLGRPIHVTEHASALGDVGDVICFVPSDYVVSDRSRDLVDSMYTCERSEHTLAVRRACDANDLNAECG